MLVLLALKSLLLGIGLFILAFVPFFWFVRFTGFTDVRAVLEALQGGEEVHLIALSKGDGYETSPFGLLSPSLAPVDVRYVQTGRGLIVPDTCAVYVVAGRDPWANAWLDENTTYLADTEIDAGEETWRVGDLVITRFYISIPPDATPGAYLLKGIEHVLRDIGEDGLTGATVQIVAPTSDRMGRPSRPIP